MSKRRIIISLACVAVLMLLVGLAIIRKFPLKTGGGPPAATEKHQSVGWVTTGADGALKSAVFPVGNGVSAPVPIYKPEPEYTKDARAAKVQGTVVSTIVVDAQGNVAEVKVIKSLDKGLDESAVNTLKTWKFNPAMKDGKTVACNVTVEVSFRLF